MDVSSRAVKSISRNVKKIGIVSHVNSISTKLINYLKTTKLKDVKNIGNPDSLNCISPSHEDCETWILVVEQFSSRHRSIVESMLSFSGKRPILVLSKNISDDLKIFLSHNKRIFNLGLEANNDQIDQFFSKL